MSLRNVSMVTSPIVGFRLLIADRGALCSYLLVSARLQLDSCDSRNSKHKAPGTKFSTHTSAPPTDRLLSPAAPAHSKRAALRRVTRKKRPRKLVDQLASLRKASPRARA